MRSLTKNFFKNERLLNLLLRAITIIAKFLLSIIIVRELSVSELGVFGIAHTTITLLIYVLGFDFYTFNAREILKPNGKALIDCVGNQLLFHAAIYLIVIPFTFFLFHSNVISGDYLILFYLVLITEHLSQEIYRLLIVFKKSVIASFLLFVRSGSWIFVLCVLWVFRLQDANLTYVFAFWFVAALLSIIIGIKYIPNLKGFSIDVNWIKSGLKIASPFFAATIFYKVMEFSGRYFLDYFSTKESVGIFTFFTSISNAIFVFVHATVIIVMSPYLIEAARKSSEDFKNTFQKFKKQILNYTMVGSVIGVVLIYPFILLIQNNVLLANLSVFFLLVIATILFCISYIPHYLLYVFDKDISLLKSSILGASINISLNFILVPLYGVTGAALAQIGGMLGLLLSKYAFSQKMLR